MIIIDLPAHAQCVEDGCKETMPIELGLLAGGGIGFRPTQPGWQMGHGGPGTALQMRCPKHARTVGIVTDIAAVRGAKGGMH